MFTNIARVACLSTAVSPASPADNFNEIKRAAGEVLPHRPDIVLLGELALSGASCGALLRDRRIAADCLERLFELAHFSERSGAVFIVGLPLYLRRRVVSAAAVVFGGQVHGFAASAKPHPFLDAYDGEDSVIIDGTAYPVAEHPRWRANGISFTVAVGYRPSDPPVAVGGDLLVVPVSVKADPVRDGLLGSRYAAMADAYGTGLAVCGTGDGESSYNGIYKNICGVFEASLPLGYDYDFRAGALLRDIDLDLLPARRDDGSGFTELGGENTPRGKLARTIAPNPFLPDHHRERILNDIADAQIQALVTRMKPEHLRRPVIGVSGGIDSTLALLVAAHACDVMELDRREIVAVSMPCFGTSVRSRAAAERLVEAVGTRMHTISIEDAVTGHFDDIGHDISEHDSVYENAQARERTQVLFDVAAKVGGLVVGTGDLSETALGWCTFNGDHISGFNVNASLTKTVVAETARTLAARDSDELRMIVDAIASAAPSPELLPGEQITQDIIGPYPLHDFFLYYFVRHSLSGEKLLSMAKQAFEGRYDDATTEATYATFLRRFTAQQFKRNCSAEGALMGDMTLSPFAYSFPSDLPKVKF